MQGKLREARELVIELLEAGDPWPGACVACGEQSDDVEPDARGYECDHCGEHQVYGVEELVMGVV